MTPRVRRQGTGKTWYMVYGMVWYGMVGMYVREEVSKSVILFTCSPDYDSGTMLHGIGSSFEMVLG